MSRIPHVRDWLPDSLLPVRATPGRRRAGLDPSSSKRPVRESASRLQQSLSLFAGSTLPDAYAPVPLRGHSPP